MKIVALATAALLALSAHAAPTAAPAAAPSGAAPASQKTLVIPVKGMHCGGCVGHVNEAVKALDGVAKVETSLEKAQTTVVFDAAKVKPEQIVAAIAATGYEPGQPSLK